ncbi:MAG: T9SS type A sorting domain-containing protein [Bacteroidetes bacterium]|nr:T9SS type A sorting domain-containing protein [Bacteroidota bacterium]
MASAAAIFDSLAAHEPGGVPFQTPVTVFHRVITTDGSLHTIGPVTETTFVRGTITSNEPDPEAPLALRLRGNYPNPFADATTVAFELPATSDVRLEVFDLLGRSVVTVDAGQMSGSTGEVEVDGSSLPNGTYLYRVTARAARGVSVATGSMVLMR